MSKGMPNNGYFLKKHKNNSLLFSFYWWFTFSLLLKH